PRGAVSRKSIVAARSRLAFQKTTKPPPPRPEDDGLTTPVASAAATAASIALPPRCRISTPAAEASRCSAATAPCFASIEAATALCVESASADGSTSGADRKYGVDVATSARAACSERTTAAKRLRWTLEQVLTASLPTVSHGRMQRFSHSFRG